MARNDDGGEVDTPEGCPSIFSHPGRGHDKIMWWALEERELNVAVAYVLLNCDEVEPYVGYDYKSIVYYNI